MASFIIDLLLIIVGFFMSPFESIAPSVFVERTRSRSASTDSTKSEIQCDSGYASDSECVDQDLGRLPQLQRPMEMHGCAHDFQIVIRAQNILYAFVAVLAMYAIDKKLLALPVFALALAIMIVPVFAPSLDVERILDLSTFSIEWTAREELEPVHVDQASSTTAPISDHAGPSPVASTLATPEVPQQKTSDTTHVSNGALCQKASGIFVPITPAQSEEMRRSQAMRDRVRRPGKHPYWKNVTKIVDDVDYEIDRSDLPFPCALHEHCHHNDFRCAKDINIEQNIQRNIINGQACPSMPPPQPGSDASMPHYDRIWYLRPTILQGNMDVDNPFNWAQTIDKHVYISLGKPGWWLIKTTDGDYVFEWREYQQVWWCSDYGFGFYEQPSIDERTHPANPYELVFGDIYARIPDPKLNGPQRTSAGCGPYWYATFYDFHKVDQEQREESALKAAELETELEDTQEKLRKLKAAEKEKSKARKARRAGPQPTAASQQQFPSAPQQEFCFTPKQEFPSVPQEAFCFTAKQAFSSAPITAPTQDFSSSFSAPTEADTKMFTETEFDFTSGSPQSGSTSAAPRQSKFAFGSSPPPSNFAFGSPPPQSNFPFGSSPSEDFEIPAAWQQNTDASRPVPVMPMQGQHQW